MKRILVLFALFAAAAGYAQTVEKQTFVYAVKQTDTLRLDRYVALTPDSRTKPCLMFVFGGGFVGGRRDNASFLSYFEYYARKGYVVVSIDYRLGMKKAMQAGTLSEETFPEAWITTLAMATGDLYDATAYVCDHASAWSVDKTRIVASGSSAGAITVLMGEYGICNGHPLARQKLPQDFNYAGVISYAGAIFDTQEELRWAKTPAPMMLSTAMPTATSPTTPCCTTATGFSARSISPICLPNGASRIGFTRSPTPITSWRPARCTTTVTRSTRSSKSSS